MDRGRLWGTRIDRPRDSSARVCCLRRALCGMQTQDQSNVGGSDSAAPWVPNSSLGTNLATKTPFCFPFVLPVISNETEFQKRSIPKLSLETREKAPQVWRTPRSSRITRLASNVAPAFGVRSCNCGTAFPSKRIVMGSRGYPINIGVVVAPALSGRVQPCDNATNQL